MVSCRAMRVWLLVLFLIGSAVGQFQPENVEWDGYVQRTDLAEGADPVFGERILRFVHVSDAHILDDDAPYPMRQEILDPYITFFSTSAQRPHEEFTDEVLNAHIAFLNELHEDDAFSFVVQTGDNIDNQQENELFRFIDNWEGTHTTTGPLSGLPCKPDGPYAPLDDTSQDVTDACTSLPVSVAQNNTPLASDLPWFTAFGNHDSLVQGNVPIEPTFQEIAANSGRFLLTQPDYVRMHFENNDACPSGSPGGSTNDDFGHGFGFAGDRLCNSSPDDDGYYAYSVNGVKFIVLDTVNDDFVTANENLQGVFTPEETLGYDVLGGYAEGALDPAQFLWLQGEVESARNEIVIITAHHTVNSMFTDLAEGYCAPGVGCLADLLTAAGYVTGTEITNYLSSQENVVAWIGGHTHQHRVQEKIGTGDHGFWNIETASLIDRPQESRIIEVWESEGKGFLRLDRVGHDFQTSKDYLALDDQQSAAQDGEEQDRDVLLWFDIPESANLLPQPSLPMVLSVTPQETEAMLGETTIAVSITDTRTGEHAGGLQVYGDLTYVEGTSSVEVLPADTLMEETPTGYQWTVNLTTPQTHYYVINVEDPLDIYPMTTRAFSLRVIGEVPDVKETPWPLLSVLALLGYALQKR